MSHSSERVAPEIRTFIAPEEVYALDSFRAQNPLTKENFFSFLGHYDFAEEVDCCVLQPSGKLCGEAHKHGWVASLRDGTCTLLGGDCGKSKFGADSNVRRAMASYNNERRRQVALTRLKELLAEKPARTTALGQAQQKLSAMQARVSAFVSNFGLQALRRVHSMAKSGRAEIVVQMVRIREEVDQKSGRARKERQRTPTVIGSLVGLSMVSDDTYRQERNAIGAALKAFKESEVLDVDGCRASIVESYAAAIESGARVTRRAEELDRMESAFWRNDWSLLWLLTSDRREQRKLAQAYLERMDLPRTPACVDAWLDSERARHLAEHRSDDVEL